MERPWLFFLCVCIAVGLGWYDLRCLRRHRARNANGQCAHCAKRLESWRVRQVRYGSRFDRTGTMIEVCLDCFARHRRGRVLLYFVLPPLVVILFICVKSAIVD